MSFFPPKIINFLSSGLNSYPGFSVLASFHDCKQHSITHNINENTDQIQKQAIKTPFWQWTFVTFPTSFCSYSPVTSINMCFPYMFVRTEYVNCLKHIKEVHHLFVLCPLIHTACYSVVEENEWTWSNFYLENPQWLLFNPLLVSWSSHTVICSGVFLNIELQRIGLQFPNSSSFQDWQYICPFQACFLYFL